MHPVSADTPVPIATLDTDGRRYRVTLVMAQEGLEYVGRLWFEDEGTPVMEGIQDRGVLPGRTEADVIARARALPQGDLLQRFRRARAEKRRYRGLRLLTRDLLDKMRYLNQVGVSMRSGLLDAEAAAQELELTEQQMVELVRQARRLAGVES
jgi:hypothetical protein